MSHKQESDNKYKWSSAIKILIITVLLFLLAIGVYYWYAEGSLIWNEESLVRQIRSFGMMAPTASIGLMILHSFLPLPGELIAMVNGIVFGSIWGIVYTWIGAMLGAGLSFGLTRKWGQPIVNRLFPSYRNKPLSILNKVHSSWSLIALRLIPFISFNLLNYALGLTSVSIWRFTWTTAVGILPAIILSVVFGDSLADSNRVLTIASGALLIILILVLWVRKRRQQSRK